jgi:hypothetical protein
VVARETLKATRKDVTAKCYGGGWGRGWLRACGGVNLFSDVSDTHPSTHPPTYERPSHLRTPLPPANQPPGDVSRKRKLLEKQKEGKKRLRQMGALQVPAEVFPELMKAL